MQFSNILLEAGAGNNMKAQFLFMAAIGLVFYFFSIKPQQKKYKEQKRFSENIKIGDWIVTVGGVHGKIIDINEEENVIVLETDTQGSKITVDKSAISIEASKRYTNK
jgi:preprotein translocase subunit YajC